MEIINIFAVIEEKLFSVQFSSQDCDEFTLAFRKWNDVEYLENFFEDNKSDLRSPFNRNIAVEEAIILSMAQAQKFELKVRNVANFGNFESKNSLQDLVFKQLHNNDTDFRLQESKAYGDEVKSWLRLYAVRISPQCYVVSGSAIKLTATMNERAHTAVELLKLKTTSKYLRENGLLEIDDFGFIDIIN